MSGALGILVLAGFGLAVVVALIVIGMYNALVKSRAHVRESWSNVDTELQRRHDLIPNLVNTVKGYASHEKDLLEQVTALREKAEALRPGAATKEQMAVEGQLSSVLGQLSVRLEAYPDLKASSNFTQLQTELAHTEDRVQQALRFYNGNVRNYNVKIESVPTNIIAGMFNFEMAEHFEVRTEEAREAPKVAF